jgi:hypothetical protein
MFQDLFGILLVGLLWGSTNPLVKRDSMVAAEKTKKAEAEATAAGKKLSSAKEWLVLLSTPSFFIPQLLNQCGSVLFVFLLGSIDISVAVPVANATALVVNGIVDVALGEVYLMKYLTPGVLLVVLGVLLCGGVI